MLKKFAHVALALALVAGAPIPLLASPGTPDPIVLSYFVTEVNGAYSDGKNLVYLAYLDRLVLVVDGRAIEAELQSFDMSRNLVNYTITRNGKLELVTFERLGSLAVMTMGDGSAIRLRFVRPLGDFDMKAIVDSGALGDRSAPVSSAQPAAPAAPAERVVTDEPAAIADPSFDCAKASTAIEGMICGNAELAGLDRQMADLYKETLGMSQDAAASRREQVEWIKGERNACKTVDCLLGAYYERIDTLRVKGGFMR